MEQLDMFEEAVSNGKRDLKPIDYSKSIGMYRAIKDVEGVDQLSEKGMQALNYLYNYHSQPIDGFIHAMKLAGLLGMYDTREVRKIMAEIDHKTELVVYASQNGYKLASNEKEIEEAVKFALAPAMTSIRRVFAKSKKETLHWLHGFIGNLEKEFGGIAQGQLQHDIQSDEKPIREVNHYPDFTASINTRNYEVKE